MELTVSDGYGVLPWNVSPFALADNPFPPSFSRTTTAAATESLDRYFEVTFVGDPDDSP